MMKKDAILSCFWGFAIGDALGVPVEFLNRSDLKNNPVTKMMGNGTHNQPIGTWSDDSSLAFCLALSLTNGYDIKKIADTFLNWYHYGFWAAHGIVFDIGIATSQALHAFNSGVNPIDAGGKNVYDNGNGSLMRIIPLAFWVQNMPIEERFKIISDVSSITHGHIRSIFSCFIYIEYVLELINGKEKFEAYSIMQQRVIDFWNKNKFCSQEELNLFHRILEIQIQDYNILPLIQYEEKEINSSGYVLHTLEASLWCFLKSNSFEEATLKAVNL